MPVRSRRRRRPHWPLAGAARSDPATPVDAFVRREAGLQIERDRVVLRGGGVRVHPFGGLGRGDRLRKASRGRSAPSQWWAISAAPTAGSDRHRPPAPTARAQSVRGARGARPATGAPRRPRQATRAASEASRCPGPASRTPARRPPGAARGPRAPNAPRPRRSTPRRSGDRRPRRCRAGVAPHPAGWRSGRPASRPASAATARVPPRSSAATSSSTKNGLPSERAWMRSRAHRRPCRRGAGRPGGRRRAARAGPGPGGSFGVARKAGEPRRHRMAGPEVVGPDGEHEEQALTVEVAGKERHEVAGRAVDPVEVLEDQHDGGVRGKVAEEPEQQAEQARLAKAAADVRRLVAASAAAAVALRLTPRPAPRAVWPMPGNSRPISSRAGPRISSMRSGGRSRR